MAISERAVPAIEGAAQVAPAPSSRARHVLRDRALFALSMTGAPIGILALRRWGRLGGVLLELASGVLLVRACVLLALGAAARLRPVPRLLLFAETALDGIATVAGFWAWVWRPFVRPAEMKQPDTGARRLRKLPKGNQRRAATKIGGTWVTTAAIGAYMAAQITHVARMAIYISPSRGLRHER